MQQVVRKLRVVGTNLGHWMVEKRLSEGKMLLEVRKQLVVENQRAVMM